MDTQMSLPFSHTIRKLPQINLAVPTKSFTPFPGRPFILRPFFLLAANSNQPLSGFSQKPCVAIKGRIGLSTFGAWSRRFQTTFVPPGDFLFTTIPIHHQQQQQQQQQQQAGHEIHELWLVGLSCFFRKEPYLHCIYMVFPVYQSLSGSSCKVLQLSSNLQQMLFFIPKSLSVKTNKKTPLDLWLFWGPSPTPFIMMLSRLLLEAPSPALDFSTRCNDFGGFPTFWRVTGNVKNPELLLFWTQNYDCKLKTSEEWFDKLVHCS